MINSRDINELHPKVQIMCRQFIIACKEAGIDVLITSTYRDYESQDDLYAQGRTKSGKIVTNARAGYSYHNFRVAFDFVPLANGKAIWDNDILFAKAGSIGKSVGLEWGGDFITFKDKPHFQFTNGLSLTNFRNGRKID